MFKLDNKSAIVTGGGSGIGKAIATALSSQGARVAILDVNKGAAEETQNEIKQEGGISLAFQCDVAVQSEVDRCFQHVFDEWDSIHIVINNAGISHIGNVEATTEEDLDRITSVNIKGVYNGLRAAVRHMKSTGGSIVNMASIVSSIGIPERFAYSMSKGAVLTMTYSVAVDYLQHGIRCNSIAPGRVHTPFVDEYLAQHYPGKEKEMFETLSKTQPIGRMGSPEEIAALTVYLCSDEASFITGSNFPIDGGFAHLKP